MDCMIARLPPDILTAIFSRLDPPTLRTVSRVCAHWRRVYHAQMCEPIEVRRALEGPSNLRFTNASWRIVGVPMIDMQMRPKLRIHAAMVRKDNSITLRKNNIEAVHRSVGQQSTLKTPRMLRLQDTHDVSFLPKHLTRALEPQMVVPVSFLFEYRFKMPFVALQTFAGFSEALSQLLDWQSTHSETKITVDDEVMVDSGAAERAFLQDEHVSDRHRLRHLLHQGRVCVVRAAAECTPTDETLYRLARFFEALVPKTTRTRGVFVHDTKLCMRCLVPKAVPLNFHVYSARFLPAKRRLSAGWRRLYDLVEPPRVSKSAQRSFLMQIKQHMFTRLHAMCEALKRGEVVSYTIPSPSECRRMSSPWIARFVRERVLEAVSLYTYRGVQVFPETALDLLMYVLHCAAARVPFYRGGSPTSLERHFEVGLQPVGNNLHADQFFQKVLSFVIKLQNLI